MTGCREKKNNTMKLIRFGTFGKEKIGVQIDDVNYDVSALGVDYNEQFF